MFDLFGIKARKAEKEAAKKREQEIKEAEKIALMKEIKAKYQERKSMISKYLEEYRTKMKDIAFSAYLEELKEVDKANSTCPKCGSHNVVNKIIRTKGEIHGKSSSSSSSYYSFTHSHSESKIDGDLDTYPVNRCKDCENEWNIREAEEVAADDDFSTYCSFTPSQLFYRIKDFIKLSYNPYDVTETCNSLEEKQCKFIEKTSTLPRFETYRSAPRYMVEYALYLGITDHHYIAKELDKIFNLHDDDDKYSYTMSDELWEITKKIIGWKGPEKC